MRGVSHQVAFFVAIAGFAALVDVAHSARALTVSIIYGLTLMALFGISAAYHRPMWSEAARRRMRRLDHAGIFIFIAGSYTPLCILGLPDDTGRNLLLFAWCFAAVGVVHALFLVHAFRTLNAVLYVVMGCALVPFIPELLTSVGGSQLGYLLAGGIIFIAGAVVYARRWPNPSPAVFGYHEVFHMMVIVAVAFHYVAVVQLVRHG